MKTLSSTHSDGRISKTAPVSKKAGATASHTRLQLTEGLTVVTPCGVLGTNTRALQTRHSLVLALHGLRVLVQVPHEIVKLVLAEKYALAQGAALGLLRRLHVRLHRFDVRHALLGGCDFQVAPLCV